MVIIVDFSIGQPRVISKVVPLLLSSAMATLQRLRTLIPDHISDNGPSARVAPAVMALVLV